MQHKTLTLARVTQTMALALVLAACSGNAGGGAGDADGDAAADALPNLPALAEAGSSKSETPAAIRNVSVDEASALINAEAPVVVLDVRTPSEFAQGHIEGAINVDVMSETFLEDLAKLDKGAAYLVHCRSGKRSAKAIEAMSDASFTDIAHMNAGMNGWSEAGLPVKN